jgi:hypothetical protein
MPSGEVAEMFSSYDLSIFSSGAGPGCAEIVEVASGGSSLSIGELWPDIDKLDKIRREDTSVVHTHDAALRGRKSIASAEKADRHSRYSGKKALLSDAAGPPNIKSKGHRSSFANRKAVQILSTAPRMILPHMRRSFVDRRYSPSTGMGVSEWEIILVELIHMRYIVKKEHDSD